jgi:hypothetical protein
MVPLGIEKVYPWLSFPVTVSVKVPDAVPLSLGFLTALKPPLVLFKTILCPTVRLAGGPRKGGNPPHEVVSRR